AELNSGLESILKRKVSRNTLPQPPTMKTSSHQPTLRMKMKRYIGSNLNETGEKKEEGNLIFSVPDVEEITRVLSAGFWTPSADTAKNGGTLQGSAKTKRAIVQKDEAAPPTELRRSNPEVVGAGKIEVSDSTRRKKHTRQLSLGMPEKKQPSRLYLPECARRERPGPLNQPNKALLEQHG
uniref:Uncharacterized protein n=1 Tax=Pseudonaja textilis TaxID=8673 RepID=A0A670Y0A2_PSETE